MLISISETTLRALPNRHPSALLRAGFLATDARNGAPGAGEGS
jgi:hypothetical protein